MVVYFWSWFVRVGYLDVEVRFWKLCLSCIFSLWRGNILRIDKAKKLCLKSVWPSLWCQKKFTVAVSATFKGVSKLGAKICTKLSKLSTVSKLGTSIFRFAASLIVFLQSVLWSRSRRPVLPPGAAGAAGAARAAGAAATRSRPFWPEPWKKGRLQLQLYSSRSSYDPMFKEKI